MKNCIRFSGTLMCATRRPSSSSKTRTPAVLMSANSCGTS
jgi:hypothetical protein